MHRKLPGILSVPGAIPEIATFMPFKKSID
jgi:hypothetical protein